MIDEKHMINVMEANFFELILLLEENDRKTIMEMLTKRLQNVLNTKHIEMIIYNRWHVQGKSMRFSHHSKKCLAPLDINVFHEYFNNKSDISYVKNSDDLIIDSQTTNGFLLKLYNKDQFSGFLYLNFNNENNMTLSFLQSIKSNVNNFLIILYEHRNKRYKLQRERALIHLSTELHTVHQTDDLLRKVLCSVEQLFPNFDFTFLMSSEYGDSNLPIKFIEYEAKESLSPGIKAFINNKLEIERNEPAKTTTFYVPLSGEQSVYGVIQGKAPYLLEFSDSIFEFINQSAKMIGKALERTMIYQESTKQVANLQLINQTTHRLNSNLNQEQIISILKEKISQSCYPESIVAVLFDESNQKVIIGDQPTSYFCTVSGHVFIDFVIDEIMKTKEPIFLGELKHSELDTKFKSLMAFPMKSSQNLMGIMIVVHTDPYYFSFDHFKLINSVVQHASLALSNTLLKEKLKKSVVTDYLTQLYSRSYLDDVIAKHMENGEHSSFILFDIDNFKLINDTHGHYIGDKILKKIARIIMEEIDEIGVAARWGGEEFAIYLPEMRIAEAVKVADVLRGAVKSKTEPQVSISCGVSMWEKEHNEDIKSLFVRTDMALYQAKESGKNKVVTDVLAKS